LSLLAERAFGLDAVALKVQPPLPEATAPAPLAVLRTQARAEPKPPLAPSCPPDPPAKVTPATLPFAPSVVGESLPIEQKRLILQQLDERHVQGCTKCVLCQSRTRTVFGEGDVDAKAMFIGEGPGENEDRTGRPFVGRAGELLDRMIAAMGLKREQVYIANIVKCRPPGNRAPVFDEVAACTPYLEKQIETIRPRVIVTLGAPSAKYILRNDKLSITRSRGQWHEYRGIKVMPTFHPAYILRSYTPQVRGQVWSDLQAVMDEIGLPRKRGRGEGV
jgi:DNA polymerase